MHTVFHIGDHIPEDCTNTQKLMYSGLARSARVALAMERSVRVNTHAYAGRVDAQCTWRGADPEQSCSRAGHCSAVGPQECHGARADARWADRTYALRQLQRGRGAHVILAHEAGAQARRGRGHGGCRRRLGRTGCRCCSSCAPCAVRALSVRVRFVQIRVRVSMGRDVTLWVQPANSDLLESVVKML